MAFYQKYFKSLKPFLSQFAKQPQLYLSKDRLNKLNIFIDIGHPAHVHYFRNFIKIMQNKGHRFFISARDKEVTFSLLNHYQIQYTSRGKGRKGLIGKLVYIIEADFKLFNLAKKFKPDLFLSFGSSYAAHVSKLIGKPHIAFDDTEHAKLEHIMYVPFTKCILTPNSFKKDFKKKHIRFNGSMDAAYLHPKYFPDDTDYRNDGSLANEIFFLLRFVSWDASHDKNQKGFSLKGKYDLIKLLEKFGKILISSEGEIPPEFTKYLFKYDPSKIHFFLRDAYLFISESGSMATEAAILGTPSIMVNTSAKYFGVFEYIKKFGNLFYYEEENEAIEKIRELLTIINLKQIAINNANKYFEETINVTDFMVWFIEQYPNSLKEMKENSDYQHKFG